MKVSVFTPHSAGGIPYIRDTWESLKAQTHEEWEWIVVENHGGQLPEDIAADPRVRVFKLELPGVGALKHAACAQATGDVLFELDHDDLIHPLALELVASRISDGADFVYSDFAEFKDGTWEPNPYSADFGWQRYGAEFQGHQLVAMKAPSDPIAWRRIEWAPNHLRAWRTETYRKIGGHSPGLPFADDHDLVLRTYLSGADCVQIHQCLYFYRVHGQQNVQTHNDEIQRCEAGVYDRHIYPLAEKIARDRSLQLIDLCGGHACPPSYTPIDLFPGQPNSIKCDLNGPWALGDSMVGALRAFDAIEHLTDPVHTMNEAWRVLAPGGFMFILVPSTDAMMIDGKLVNGSGAYCDPTHVSFWNQMSFRYYSSERFAKYVPQLKARFQVARLETINAGGIPYVRAELIALKEGYSPMGAVGGP